MSNLGQIIQEIGDILFLILMFGGLLYIGITTYLDDRRENDE